jgi:hypothetical protein
VSDISKNVHGGFHVRKVVFATMFLALFAECVAAQQQRTNPPQKRTAPVSQVQHSSVHPMSAEEAFFYYTAIFGEDLNNSFIMGSANNIVDRYALAFDSGNYARAMSDEFSRSHYRAGIQARIAAGVRRVDFSHKFIAIGGASLSEYNFASHSFQFTPGAGSSFCLGSQCSNLRVDVGIQDAVNVKDFNWSLAMPESEARAFLKGRTLAGGGSNRSVTLRVTYSIVPLKGRPPVQLPSSVPQHASLRPFIHSVEIYSDQSLSKRLGVIANQPGIPESAYSTAVNQAARSASTVIGKYRYKVLCGNTYSCTPREGTITVTDVSIVLSGEQPDGSTKPMEYNYFDAFANGSTELWRSDWGDIATPMEYYVVWKPYWRYRSDSDLLFTNRPERDHFFTGLALAIQHWKGKYPQFASNQLKIYEGCDHNEGGFVTCPETPQ